MNYTPPVGSSDTAITHFSFAKMIVDEKEFRDVDVAIGLDGKARPWRMQPVAGFKSNITAVRLWEAPRPIMIW